MGSLAEENAKLEAQRAYFSDDKRIRDEAAMWAAASPEQRLAEAARLCAAGGWYWSRLPAEVRVRVQEAERLPPDSVALLERLHRSR